MATGISNENIKVDFGYFITSALQNKITWEFLDNFLNDVTPNLATSKQVIKMLLKELQKLQSELQKVQTQRASNKVQILDHDHENEADIPENPEDSHSTTIDQTFSVQIQVNQTKNDQINIAQSNSVQITEKAQVKPIDQMQENILGDSDPKSEEIKSIEGQVPSFEINNKDFEEHEMPPVKAQTSKFTCDFCAKEFSNKITYNKHKRNAH